MKKRIYVTYCSKQKSACAIKNSRSYLLSKLYTSSRVQEFISFCEKHGFVWAIFSDKYGLIHRNEKIKWYNKSPNSVTDDEYNYLLKLTIRKLIQYDEVIFFYKQESFHPLYKRLVCDLQRFKCVTLVTRLEFLDEG